MSRRWRARGRDGAQRVSEESCSALVRFDGGAFATVVAGYVGAPGLPDTPVRFVCARGSAVPDAEAGALTLYRGGEPEVLSFPRQPSRRCVRPRLPRRHRTANGAAQPPEDALWDVRLAEAVAQARASGDTSSSEPYVLRVPRLGLLDGLAVSVDGRPIPDGAWPARAPAPAPNVGAVR